MAVTSPPPERYGGLARPSETAHEAMRRIVDATPADRLTRIVASDEWAALDAADRREQRAARRKERSS